MILISPFTAKKGNQPDPWEKRFLSAIVPLFTVAAAMVVNKAPELGFAQRWVGNNLDKFDIHDI